MPSTKKLLSITNLKKYFPVAKSSIFQRTKRYVRANENITIDIYEGETLGIVGESGCGKSTLGRVLLQLYPQTAGCTLYYGVTLDELTPAYMYDTIKNEGKYRKKLAKATAKPEDLQRKVDAAGGEDTAEQLTEEFAEDGHQRADSDDTCAEQSAQHRDDDPAAEEENQAETDQCAGTESSASELVVTIEHSIDSSLSYSGRACIP